MLRPHERALLDSLGIPHDDGARAALNAYFLTDAGLAELRARLAEGTYRIEIPEEAALLVVAWLREHDAPGEATAILDAIGPALERDRFYPVPHAQPEPARGLPDGVTASPEALAAEVTELAAPVAVAGVRDPDLRRLAEALHRVQPLAGSAWGRAILRTGEDASGVQVAARAALLRVIELAIVTWPHAGLPAPLVRAARPLVVASGLPLPLVDADATDERWLRAAKRACRLLDGTLYATYYGVPCAAIQRLDDPHELIALAERRAGATGRNAAVNEQLEILTTANVAVLIGGLGITPRLAASLPGLARRCFTEAADQAARGAVESAALAWRQMILFLSLAPRPALDDFVMWAGAQVAALPGGFRARFGPAYAGLCLAAAGMTPGEATAPGARPLLGRTLAPHWLLDGA